MLTGSLVWLSPVNKRQAEHWNQIDGPRQEGHDAESPPHLRILGFDPPPWTFPITLRPYRPALSIPNHLN
jgi:hypothetical protein